MLAWIRHTLATRRGFRFWLILSILMVLTAPLAIFEPYDWLQRGLTEAINRKPYQGDATIIAIDQKTVEAQADGIWTRAALADLIDELNDAGAKRIFIDRQRFSVEHPEGGEKLAAALARLERKAVWHVEARKSRISDPSTEPNLPDGKEKSQDPGNFPADGTENFVEPATLEYGQSPFGTPIYIPATIVWNEQIFPSVSHIMADSYEPVLQVSHWLGDYPVIDTSYDIDSIPSVSALQLLNGGYSQPKIKGRNVVITDLGEATFTAQKTFTPRAAIAILGAQTLLDGPQYQLYLWPPLIIALLASLGWTLLPRPNGRIVGLIGFLVILISPLIFERFLIYQNTSQGILFMLVFTVGRVIIQTREVLSVYRSVAETKSRFLAQASHDLRQPIHAVGLLAEQLRQTGLSSAQQEIVAKISWSTDHASRMFKSLLDLAILESGTLKPKLSVVPINDLLVEIDNQNALIAEQAGVTLRFVPSEAAIYTDRALANTMLQNLVSNAIKYGGEGDVLVGCRREGGTIAICVYDQGPGISKKEVQLVSQEFYRGQKLDIAGTDGVGLGLAIVRGMADLLKLKFVIKSNPGNGTVAKIAGFLTAEQEPQQSFIREVEDLDILSGKQILAIDDDLDTLQSTAGLLDMWGCSVSTANSISIEDISRFDIILSDFDFGGGVTLATYRDQIMELQKSGVCVVIISGHHPDHIEREMQSSAITILAKPVHPADLKSALIAELLE